MIKEMELDCESYMDAKWNRDDERYMIPMWGLDNIDFEEENSDRESEMDYANFMMDYDEDMEAIFESEEETSFYDDYIAFKDEYEETFYDEDTAFDEEYERFYDDYMHFEAELEERYYDEVMDFENKHEGFTEFDMDFEAEFEERLEHETAVLALLRGQNLIVYNSDGTLRCPLCPSRKTQAYSYKDLLQHATAVSSGKLGPEAAGKHSALKTFLEPKLLSQRFPYLEQHLPPRRQAEDMLVCPWSVVIYNIDRNILDWTRPETCDGLRKSILKLYFADFNPVQLVVYQGSQYQPGACVVEFGRDLSGLKDAQALERSFIDQEHGLRDCERRLDSGDLGENFYGWLAREADYNGRRCGLRGEEIGKYLRDEGNLKDIEMVGDEFKRMHDQLVGTLAATVSEKSKESQVLKTEMEKIRRRAEAERQQLEESHKLELEEVRVKARISEEDFRRESKKIEELEEKLAELQSTQEYQEETITTLTVKERESNDELVDGREMAVQVIQYINEAKRLIEAALKKKGQLDKSQPQEANYKQPQPKVEVKRAGAIDDTAWPRAFKRKYKRDGDWGMKMTEVFSSWEARIINPEFQPFKTVQIGEDKWEQQIDDENEGLAYLKTTHGEAVYNSVATALMEIEEYNSSGRYPVSVAWNFKKSRKASLKEVIQYLGRIIDSLVAPEVLAHLGRTVESLMGPGASRKRSRN